MAKLKEGKRTKVLALADGSSLPITVDSYSVILHEVKLVDQKLDARFIDEDLKN